MIMMLWGKKSANGFTSSSTAEQVTEGVDGSGLTAFITGGTSGIGKESVRVLAKRGVHVYIGARNIERAAKVKEDVLKETPIAKVDLIKLDTSSLESVRKAAAEFLALNVPLNILICNAGIMLVPFEKSKDGIELTFATNYLGHFLLTKLLLDKIKETAKESGIEGKIINVTSMAHALPFLEYKEGIRFDKLNEEEGFSKSKAYGQSKLAQVLSTKYLAKVLQDEGANVTVNSVHPGGVKTNLAAEHGIYKYMYMVANLLPIMKTPEQGAATQCYLALNPGAKGVTGKYYADVNELPSPSKFVKDDELAKKLWDFSVELTAA